MPLTNSIISNEAARVNIERNEGDNEFVAASRAFIARLGNVYLSPASLVVTAPVTACLWRVGDRAFQLSAAFIRQAQRQYENYRLSEYPALHDPIIGCINHALKEQGKSLPTLQLLGPASVFYALYPVVARFFKHQIPEADLKPLTQSLATYLAGACEVSFEQLEPHFERSSLAWQSQPIDADVILENDAGQLAEFNNPIPFGLPGTRPLYSTASHDSLYHIAADSSAIFIGDDIHTPMAFCLPQTVNNATQDVSIRPVQALDVHVDVIPGQTTYALSTHKTALNVSTHRDAPPALALPNISFKDPLIFPMAASTVLAVKTAPWSTAQSRQSRGVVQDGALALMYKDKNTPLAENPLPRLKSRLTIPSSVTVEEQLHRMNILDIDGLLQPLFAPSGSTVDCLSCLPTPAAPVKAGSMTEMFEKAFRWAESLSFQDTQQVIDRYMAGKRYLFSVLTSGKSSSLGNIIAACEWLSSQHPLNQTLSISTREAETFLTGLFADSPFDHNEELKIALIASSTGEAILAKLLMKQLDHFLPASAQLIATSNQHLRMLMNQTQPVTYGRLEGYFKTLQDSFISRLAASFKGPIGILPDLLTAQKILRIAYWHKCQIEFDYPFMLLRHRQDLEEDICLSDQGLLLNMGVRRVIDREKIATISRRDFIALGQDLLLNNSPETLVIDFSPLDALFTQLSVKEPRGIIYAANQFKRLGVLLIQFSEAKRNLATALADAAGHDEGSALAFQNFRHLKQQLYALALESIPEEDKGLFLLNLQRMKGVDLQFIRLSDTYRSAADARPYIGFILSSAGNAYNASPDLYKRNYFFSLMPVQSDTTKPLFFKLEDLLPDEITAREDYINTEGKEAFIARLSESMLQDSSRYYLHVKSEGQLHVALPSTNWPQVANTLAGVIISRQFSTITAPRLGIKSTTVSHSEASSGRVYTWFRHLIKQIIYLTPLGSCKDAVDDIVQAHIAPLLLDGAFCLYAFAPAGSEEEQGIKSVANIIKNTLKKSLKEDIIADEGKPVLANLDHSIKEVEALIEPNSYALHPVSYHRTANAKLTSLLTLPACFQAIPVKQLPHDYQPASAWRDPLHDVLYFTFTLHTGEKVAYRFDEHNQLLLPNTAPSLMMFTEHQHPIVDPKLLKETLNTGNTQQLRMEIYQHGRMQQLENYAVKNRNEIPQHYSVIADSSEGETRYYPGIKQEGSDSLYLLVPENLADDQQLVIDLRNGRMHYWRDNVICFKPGFKIDPLAGTEDAYNNLLNSLTNIPAGWTLDNLWIEQGSGNRLVASWRDTEGNWHYRHPDKQGKWLPWSSRNRGIFCQHLTRPKRNDIPNQSLSTEFFSPEHCGYLNVPRITSPEKAAALNALIVKFNSLGNPVMLEKIDCADLARKVIDEFSVVLETVPQSVRNFITHLRDWNIDVREFNDLETVTNKLSDYSFALNSSHILPEADKLLRNRFIRRVLSLIQSYRELKEKVIESKRLKEEFRVTKTDYYKTYIVRNLKANNWLNRLFTRAQGLGKVTGDYIIKAETPEKIRKNYGFLFEGITGAITRLQAMSSEISARLADPASTQFLADNLKQFFNATFTPLQVKDFSSNLAIFLDKISDFSIDDVVVVADRLAEGKLGSGCFETPIEKLIYGDGAYSFVYNSGKDKRIYLLDYLSNQEFIEYSLAHELGHLAFNDIDFAFQEEIYLKSDTILKNFNLSGAAKFAKHLMSDKMFFLEYIAKHTNFATAFYYHFYAHSRNSKHKSALRNYYSLFLDRKSMGSIYQNDLVLRKREMVPLVDYLFSQPNIQLNIAYYNPDLFCGLFNSIFESTQALPGDEIAIRRRRDTTGSELKNEGIHFMSLLFSALYQQHLLHSDVALAVE
ncbi:hypothetical protein [Serratia sp. M24T3]|uniref:hypothetical protein n=1 Tax=Serratia sp. M24T3 TaxID=932213 RepID=UPI00025BBE28|nr:hypothetical protein [Serratia sp. M24T3]EIC85059.1 hypothetical protein SPM24T3_08284 [Serratia sp. M24T3]